MHGLKFRRQQVIDGFIADFYCNELRLIVEIDGGVHESQKDYDKLREWILSRNDIKIIRFSNGVVIHQFGEVIKQIGELLPPSPDLSGEGRGEVKIKFKTDYPGHDALYRRRKESGSPGWDDEQTWQAWRKEILDLIASGDLPKSGKVLEIGCGAGDVSLLFAERGFQVSGIDISSTAIEWAKEKAQQAGIKAEFNVGDVRDLGLWGDETFDIAIDGHCLHCIIGNDRTEVLKEAYRVLKPGGLFYVSTMCGEPKDPEVIKMFDAETRCTVWGGVARRYIGKPEDILKEIKQHGFKIVRHEVQLNKDSQDGLVVLAEK